MCFALGGGVGGLLLFLLARDALIDDAYITLDYARSLALHGQWALEPGHVANTATSPLNVLLLALITVVTRAPFLAVAGVLAGSLALLGLALSSICGRLGWNRWPAALAPLAVVVNPLLAATVGMETYLGIALIACLGWAAVARRPGIAGLVIGLLVLTRPDLVMFGVAVVAVPSLVRRLHVVASTALLTALPWFAVSWWVLGSALPDTVLLKVGDHWGPWTFVNGLQLYFGVYPAAVLLSVVPAACGVVAAAVWFVLRLARCAAAGAVLAIVWGGGACLHAVLFVALGTAPYHWYYGPLIGSLTLLGTLSLAAAPAAIRAIGLVVGAVGLIATVVFLVQRPWSTAPITTNWATAQQYRDAAALVPAGAVVRSPGEIGTLAYYCDCTVVDGFSDRALITPLIQQRSDRSGRLGRQLLAVNYARLATGPPLDPRLQFVVAQDGPGVSIATPWRSAGVLRVGPIEPTPA
ncbi:hypothetical protein LWC33_02730 [Pseudonocardia sp. RS11V-5]|uniref:hypothetical protein n=1 Tax=Pseudonocardia terrae TaxID=2905831 RepID=UPI001E4902F6|nr:hypothetical protein [Pseudonocardia terrae]MCE3550374.1 hypothetical protein [Pseudonocardia terrae]